MAEQPPHSDHSTTTITTPLLRTRYRLLHKTTIATELSGAVGDLGTYIPIVLTLVLVNHLDLSTTLIFTALYNIATGLLFNIPMPVQPMKSIAAVAISESPNLTVPQILAAGISTGTVLLVLGATGMMSVLYKYLPLPVVRGVQLSQGLAFAFSGIKYVRNCGSSSSCTSGGPRPWLGLDGLVVALCAVLFLILTTGSGDDERDREEESTSSMQEQEEGSVDDEGGRASMRWRLKWLSAVPSALLVFLLGVILCFIRDPSIVKYLKFGPSRIQLVKISWEDWKIGFVRAAIPQIPLSILNSVIAVCKLSADLFPDREVSARKVSVSVGVMNLIGCWFGAMPVCHGAGGLAGQYRFGGRTGASVIFLGIGKLVIGLAFGNSFVRILTGFPVGILGVLLLFSGIELAMASRDMRTKEESFVMLVCAAISLTGSSAALGFGCGIVLFLLLKLRRYEGGFWSCLRRGKDVLNEHGRRATP